MKTHAGARPARPVRPARPGRRSAVMLAFFACLALLAGCGGREPQGAYYRPSPERFVFDYGDDAQTFAEYVNRTRAYLARNRVFFGGDSRQRELDRVSPYELPAASHCGREETKGVLMIHGALGTAYALADVARALHAHAAERGDCMLVRGLLLAGHGTRMGDTTIVDNDEWIRAVEFGIRGLMREAGEVHLVGFSLGGLLAAHAAMRHPDLAGIVMFSPSLVLESSDFIGVQTMWARYLRKYLYVIPDNSAVRYQSMSMNLAAQIVGLRMRTAAAMRLGGGIKPPVLAYLTHDDISIDPLAGLGVLEARAVHPQSRFIYYTSSALGGDDIIKRDDPRTAIRDSYLPDERILDFAHVSFVYAPENDLFGRDGRLKECGQNIGHSTRRQIAACMASDNNWRGEIAENGRRPGFEPLQRLTYHPRFDAMIKEVFEFMDGV